jgi:hypothetical protein
MTEPIDLRINSTAAQLLARLCVELGTDDYAGVVVRALGLLEMAQRTKVKGGRLVFVDDRGNHAEVAF